MKRKLLLGMSFALLFSFLTMAQEIPVPTYNNAIKLNTLGLVLNNVSLVYERHLNPHWSLLAGVGYRWGGGLPKMFGLGDLVVSNSTRGIRGYTFTPELRYYFNYCECGGSPSGFYAGLYSRVSKYYGKVDVLYWTGSEFVDIGAATEFNETGAGIQLGYQFIFKERFSLDIMFAGPRLSSNRLRFSVASEYVDELAPIIEEEINKRLDWFGIDPISISSSGEIDTRFGFRNFRYGIAFGFMF